MSTEHVMRYRYSDNVTEQGIEVTLERFVEVKKTPCGAWVEQYYGPEWYRGKKRFVLDGPGKRYCYQTKELAWESFRIRKQWQERRARLTLSRAEFALSCITHIGEAPEQTVDCGRPAVWERYSFE